MTGRGTNGLRVSENLAQHQKCPTTPNKAVLKTVDYAWQRADQRSEESGLTIVPYACPGCGHYHLTRDIKSAEVIDRNGVTNYQHSVAQIDNKPAVLPERLPIQEAEPTPELQNDDGPIVWTRPARIRNFAQTGILETTVFEYMERYGLTIDTARSDLRLMKWKAAGGPRSLWRHPDYLELTNPEAKKVHDVPTGTTVAEMLGVEGGKTDAEPQKAVPASTLSEARGDGVEEDSNLQSRSEPASVTEPSSTSEDEPRTVHIEWGKIEDMKIGDVARVLSAMGGRLHVVGVYDA